jgi:hypothetical protein
VTGSRKSKSIEIAQETPDGSWNPIESIEGSFAGEDGLVTIIWSTSIFTAAREVFFQRQ